METRQSRILQTTSSFLILAVLCLFSVVNAAAFEERIDQSNLPPWAGGWTHVNPTRTGRAAMWQTFTPGYSNLTAVEIDILTVNPGQGDDTLTVEIAKEGDILASADNYVVSGFDGLLRFEFADIVSVVPEELYELKVHDTGKTSFGWRYASNTYDRGSRYINAEERLGTDWFFRTYALPEPSIIYVDDDAAGANDGSSWENAYVYLQDALADANSAEKPIEIRVAQGIYKPDQGANQTPGDREATFQLINNVTLKGGFIGIVGADPNLRIFEVYRTILSGDLNGDDVEVVNPEFLQPTRAENSHHVVTCNNIDKTAVLDGLVITGGTGGGMHNSQSNPTLLNCTFSGNWGHANGSGIYNFQSNPTLTDCTFSENYGRDGGGMYNAGSSPTLTNCIFHGNRAVWGGGGMYNVYNVYDGQGMTLGSQSNPVLTKCIFSKNSADEGGGMYNRGGPHHSSPTLIRCTFSGNWTEGEGGGINNYQSDPVLIHCTFSGNLAFMLGAGMYNQRRSSPTLTNCTFSGNSTNNSGGGMYNSQSTPALINCTFAQNSARNGNALAFNSSGQNGPSTVELTNCILWDYRNEMWGPDNPGDEIWNNDNSTITMTYSNVKGGFPGKGNIDSDPLFADLGYFDDYGKPYEINDDHWLDGDYHLKSQEGRWDPNSESWVVDNVTSPCIDAGDPNSPVGDETEPNGGRINMGAYGGTTEASKSYTQRFFQTTQGPVLAEGLGIILPHEHIFTDLRGPTTPGYGQADPADVVRVMAPLLEDARRKGVGVMFECSSIGVGRNPFIIDKVAQASGLPVVIPTGVYGRANFAPPEHQNMSEDELTTLFIKEIRDGIENTGIKAGFIKIATSNSPISALEEKFLRAAGRAARETGAAIASHTPRGSNATIQTDILQSIDPKIRFIWVHAQNESNRNLHLELAGRGVFIEFDALGGNPGKDSTFISAIKGLLDAGHEDRIMLSHDAGWYRPGEPNGGTQRSYTYLMDTFIGKLKNAGVDEATIQMITEINPIRAFGIKVD